MIADFIKAIWAGAFIAVGAMIFTHTGGVAGVIFFSVGLLSIMFFDLKLYTGMIGFVKTGKELAKSLFILVGNFVGTTLAAVIHPEDVSALVSARLEVPLYEVFLKSFVSGLLVYAAVWVYRNKQNWMYSLIAIPGFIFAGAYHCIADMCYIMAARAFTWQALFFIITVILGNSIGAFLFDKTKNL